MVIINSFQLKSDGSDSLDPPQSKKLRSSEKQRKPVIEDDDDDDDDDDEDDDVDDGSVHSQISFSQAQRSHRGTQEAQRDCDHTIRTLYVHLCATFCQYIPRCSKCPPPDKRFA